MAELTALRTMVAAMQQNAAPAPAPAAQTTTPAPTPAPAPAFNFAAVDITDAERTQFASSMPFIEKVVQQALATHLAPRLNEFAQQTVRREDITDLTSSVQATGQSAFQIGLRTAIPDIDAVGADPAFVQHLNSPVSAITGDSLLVGNVLNDAVKRRDIATVQRIVQNFRVQQGQPAAVPPQAALQAPYGTQATVTSAQLQPAAPGPVLKWSARKDAGLQFQKGLITKQQLDQVDAIYGQAFSEGRVDMNT